MARRTNGKVAAIGIVAIIAILLLLYPQSPVYYNPTAKGTGVFLKGCMYDSAGKSIGCSTSTKIPLTQASVNSSGGQSVARIALPSAYAKINYTGQVQSWSIVGTEKVDYDKIGRAHV